MIDGEEGSFSIVMVSKKRHVKKDPALVTIEPNASSRPLGYSITNIAFATRTRKNGSDKGSYCTVIPFNRNRKEKDGVCCESVGRRKTQPNASW